MRYRLLCASAMAAVMAGCARIAAPSGGPEDTEPPFIVSLSPEPSAGTPDLDEVAIRWSERMQESSVEIRVFPAIPIRVGNSVGRTVVSLEEPLGARTMILHVSGTAADLRGNRIVQAVDLAYSGLDTLPSGSLRIGLARQGGTVLGGSVQIDVLDALGTMVRRTSPDSTGSAVAGWLPGGAYSVICFEDGDGSMSWERDIEAGAETTVVIGDADSLDLELVLTVVDTVGPRLVQVLALDEFHAQVDFNEEPALPADARRVFGIRDTSGVPVPVLGCWSSGSREERSLVLATGGMPEGVLLLRTEGVTDLLGNASAPDSIEFESSDSASVDTIRVRSTFPAPGSTDVPASTSVVFSLSDWVDPDSLAGAFSMTRVADSTVVEGVLRADDGRSFTFTPLHDLLGEEQYRVEIGPGLVSPAGDSLGSVGWSFVAAWGDEPGSMEGTVSGGGARIVLEARAAGSGGASISVGIDPGRFLLEGIPAGRYTVSCWSDRNGNGAWDPGEPYGSWPGVVLVRPGTVTGGIDVEILP